MKKEKENKLKEKTEDWIIKHYAKFGFNSQEELKKALYPNRIN